MVTLPPVLWRTIAGMVGAAVLVGVLATTTVATGAATRAPEAIRIHSASLTQDGQQLVWRVVTDDPFTPSSLATRRVTLCLIVARPKPLASMGELCVGGSRHGAHTVVFDRQIKRSGATTAARAIPATVTRTNGEELTASFLPASIGLGYRSLRWQALSTSTASSCSPAVAGCSDRRPIPPALAKLHTPQLVGCIASGPNWVFRGPSNVHAVALTFDDGPWYQTPQFLDVLEREHVPATFFEIGDQISAYGEGGAIERRMLADGDMIGDHTWNHHDVAGAGMYARGEIAEAAAAISKATGGFEPCLFRAPYGDVSPALLTLARSMGFTTIQWNVDPRDWALPGVAEIEDNIIDNARNGAIIEEHDGGGNRSETIAALPDVIATLRARGYTFETLTQMLGYQLIYH